MLWAAAALLRQSSVGRKPIGTSTDQPEDQVTQFALVAGQG